MDSVLIITQKFLFGILLQILFYKHTFHFLDCIPLKLHFHLLSVLTWLPRICTSDKLRTTRFQSLMWNKHKGNEKRGKKSEIFILTKQSNSWLQYENRRNCCANSHTTQRLPREPQLYVSWFYKMCQYNVCVYLFSFPFINLNWKISAKLVSSLLLTS